MALKLFHDDCLSALSAIEPGSVDFVCCDPPYGEIAQDWDKIIPFDQLWPLLWRALKPNGAVLLMAMQPFSAHVVLSDERNYRYSWYWHKQAITGFANAKRQPLRDIEEACVFYRKLGTYNPQGVRKLSGADKHRKNGAIRRQQMNGNIGKGKGTMYVQEFTNYPRQLLSIGRDEDAGEHPTQKPVGLMSYFVKTYTNPGDTVLDFTMGSGTTGVACVGLMRNFIGIEKERKYFDIAKRRIDGARSPFDPKGFHEKTQIIGPQRPVRQARVVR